MKAQKLNKIFLKSDDFLIPLKGMNRFHYNPATKTPTFLKEIKVEKVEKVEEKSKPKSSK